MKRSIEDIIKLVAVKQAAPPPTRLEKPSTVKEDPTRPMATLCGVTYPREYNNGIAVGHYSVIEVYRDMIPWMYCRPQPDGTCMELASEFEATRPEHTVTDRDLPLTWQRGHPEFNPDDPNTWGSLFGPGGWVDQTIRYANCPMDENNRPIPCHSEETLREFADIIRQLYAARCGFITAQTGSCCEFSEFGTATCSQTASFSCPGVFTAGGNCNGANPCGPAPNPVQQNDQGKKPTPIMDMVMSILKRK